MTHTFTQRIDGPSLWHIRPLTFRGQHPIHGTDTESVCGAVKEGDGRDRSDLFSERNLMHACQRCVSGAGIVPVEAIDPTIGVEFVDVDLPKFLVAIELLKRYDAAAIGQDEQQSNWLWNGTMKEAWRQKIPDRVLFRAKLAHYGEKK